MVPSREPLMLLLLPVRLLLLLLGTPLADAQPTIKQVTRIPDTFLRQSTAGHDILLRDPGASQGWHTWCCPEHYPTCNGVSSCLRRPAPAVGACGVINGIGVAVRVNLVHTGVNAGSNFSNHTTTHHHAPRTTNYPTRNEQRRSVMSTAV